MKCDGTRAETRFRLSAKRTRPFKSAGASVQSTTGSRGVRISGSNAGCTMFRGSVKSTGYPLHSPVFPSLSLPCVTVCYHISTALHVTLRVEEPTHKQPDAPCCALELFCASVEIQHLLSQPCLTYDAKTECRMPYELQAAWLTIGMMSYCHISTF